MRSLIDLIDQYDKEQQYIIQCLRDEVKEWKDKYTNLLHADIKHSEAMFNLVLESVLTKSDDQFNLRTK